MPGHPRQVPVEHHAGRRLDARTRSSASSALVAASTVSPTASSIAPTTSRMSRSSSTSSTRALGPCAIGSVARQWREAGRARARRDGRRARTAGPAATAAWAVPGGMMGVDDRIVMLPAAAKSTRRSQSRRSKASTGPRPRRGAAPAPRPPSPAASRRSRRWRAPTRRRSRSRPAAGAAPGPRRAGRARRPASRRNGRRCSARRPATYFARRRPRKGRRLCYAPRPYAGHRPRGRVHGQRDGVRRAAAGPRSTPLGHVAGRRDARAVRAGRGSSAAQAPARGHALLRAPRLAEALDGAELLVHAVNSDGAVPGDDEGGAAPARRAGAERHQGAARVAAHAARWTASTCVVSEHVGRPAALRARRRARRRRWRSRARCSRWMQFAGDPRRRGDVRPRPRGRRPRREHERRRRRRRALLGAEERVRDGPRAVGRATSAPTRTTRARRASRRRSSRCARSSRPGAGAPRRCTAPPASGTST